MVSSTLRSDFAYAGKVALGVILADPTGELIELQRLTENYPDRRRDAVVKRCLWEVGMIDIGPTRAYPGRMQPRGRVLAPDEGI